MKAWRMLVAMPAALLASQALAENWITVATSEDGGSYAIDKDSIRRGTDRLVYFSEAVDGGDDGYFVGAVADCPRRITYTQSMSLQSGSPHVFPDWRDHGQGVKAGSIAEVELQYACTNVR